VNGAAGAVITVDGKPVSIVGFTVVNDRIVAIDALVDPERIASLAPRVPRPPVPMSSSRVGSASGE